MASTNSIEGNHGTYFNASYYVEMDATSTWQKVSFTDYSGTQFDAMNIRLSLVDTDPVDFSFDPYPDATYPSRVVHGQLHSGDKTIELTNKRATEIWIKRHNATDSTLHIMAWRS